MITSKTSFLALVGDPVAHSLSPIMQNAAIKYLGLDLIYIAIPCKEKDLGPLLNSFKNINCKGLNITIPHKQKVFDFCNDVTPVAKRIKAINTLKLTSEKEWLGTNTDVYGFIYPLKSLNLINKKSIVLGSGGSARSVVKGLIDLKLSKITVISRNKASLDKLILNFKNDISIEGLLKNEENSTKIDSLIEQSNLIVNTTPVGMDKISKNNELLPFSKDFWKAISSKTIVYDLIYNPRPTELLKFCDKKGCLTLDGSQMLIAQGAKSLSFWTDGLDIPFEVMKDALKKYL